MAVLAAAKGVAPREFEKMYCRWVSWPDDDGRLVQRLSLRERTSSAGGQPSEDCIFWRDGCAVYEARPFQCRSYPFWRELLASKKAWREAARSCPGIGRDAGHSGEPRSDESHSDESRSDELHSMEEIEGILAEERAQRIVTR